MDLEQAIRTAALTAGILILEQLLAPLAAGRQEAPVLYIRGASMQSRNVCAKNLDTAGLDIFYLQCIRLSTLLLLSSS